MPLMRVYDLNLTGSAAAETGRAQETQRAEKGAGTGSSAKSASAFGDRVELSSTLGRLSQAISADGQERAARVQALAAQYQAGNYNTDSMATARGMVAEALATGG
jgi:anti-sigma28 factor (negative regulator of flagellin synthesis)